MDNEYLLTKEEREYLISYYQNGLITLINREDIIRQIKFYLPNDNDETINSLADDISNELLIYLKSYFVNKFVRT